jgi:hypothetical protein
MNIDSTRKYSSMEPTTHLDCTSMEFIGRIDPPLQFASKHLSSSSPTISNSNKSRKSPINCPSPAAGCSSSIPAQASGSSHHDLWKSVVDLVCNDPTIVNRSRGADSYGMGDAAMLYPDEAVSREINEEIVKRSIIRARAINTDNNNSESGTDFNERYSKNNTHGTHSGVKKYKTYIDELAASPLATLRAKSQEEGGIDYEHASHSRKRTQASLHEVGESECNVSSKNEAIFTFAYMSPYSEETLLSQGHTKRWDKYNEYHFFSVHQVVELLGCQTLGDLLLPLYCLSGLSKNDSSSGDVIQSADNANNRSSEIISKGCGECNCSSGIFYIENTVYQKDLSAHNINSNRITTWLTSMIGIEEVTSEVNFPVCGMDALIKSIKWRIGAKYLYLHLGACEHILVLLDIRSPNVVRPRLSERINPTFLPSTSPEANVDECDIADYYPRERFLAEFPRRKCSVCGLFAARHLVVNDRLSDSNPSYFCPACHHSLHYDENNNLLYDDFAVFPYWHDVK